MPEETSAEPTQNENESPVQIHEVNLASPKPKGSKLPLISGIIVLVLLLGAAGYFFAKSANNSKSLSGTNTSSTNNSTSSANANKQPQKETINKVGYVDGGNIWVLDVTTKAKTQITKDGSTDSSKTYYRTPIFINPTTFVYVKYAGTGSELWKGEFSGNTFSVTQEKKFKSQITLQDITHDYKTIVFTNSVSDRTKLHIFDLATDKDTVVYDEASIGRGTTADDAFYAAFSPNGSKVFYVDTIGGGGDQKIYGSNPEIRLAAAATNPTPIMIWDISGKKLGTISGHVTLPVWLDENTLIYKETGVGLHKYNVSTKGDTKMNSETDWTSLAISPNLDKIAFDKGFQATESGMSDSSIGLLDTTKNTSSILEQHIEHPVWVNENYLVAGKIRKCNPGECLIDDSFTNDTGLVVINLTDNKTFEVSTTGVPSFKF